MHTRSPFNSFSTSYVANKLRVFVDNQHVFSLNCFPYISFISGKENLFNNQDLFHLSIISLFLKTLMIYWANY